MKTWESLTHGMATLETLDMLYSNASFCGEAGLTKDGSIVTTKECCDYQIKKGSLVLRVKSNKGHTSFDYFSTVKMAYKNFIIKRNEYGSFEFHNQWDGEITPASDYQDCIEQIDELSK